MRQSLLGFVFLLCHPSTSPFSILSPPSSFLFPPPPQSHQNVKGYICFCKTYFAVQLSIPHLSSPGSWRLVHNGWCPNPWPRCVEAEYTSMWAGGSDFLVHTMRLPLPTWASSELRAAAALQVTAMSCHCSPAQAS